MKKLLVVMGAGASIEFGMPSVAKIDKLMDNWAQNYFRIIDSDTYDDNLYRWVKKTFPLPKEDEGNFEKTLFVIQNLASLSASKDSWLPKVFTVNKEIEFPKVKLIDGYETIADPSVFAMLQSRLNQELATFMRDRSIELVDTKKKEVKITSEFFKHLKTEYDLGFINLNYDSVLENVLPNLNTGFDTETGKFDMESLYSKDWNFCYHLHGSVYFDMRSDEEIFWSKSLNDEFPYGPTQRRGFVTNEGAYHPMSTIITGLDKINQVYRQPFRQYFFQLDQKIFESDAILFIGYGFNDSYINKIVRSHAKDDGKIRNVVVIDYQNENMPTISEGNKWGFNVTAAVYSPHYQMGNGSLDINYRPDKIGEYFNTKTFEFSDSKKNPLYVWYSGFMDACNNKERVLKALKGYFYITDSSIDKNMRY